MDSYTVLKKDGSTFTTEVDDVIFKDGFFIFIKDKLATRMESSDTISSIIKS